MEHPGFYADYNVVDNAWLIKPGFRTLLPTCIRHRPGTHTEATDGNFSPCLGALEMHQ